MQHRGDPRSIYESETYATIFSFLLNAILPVTTGIPFWNCHTLYRSLPIKLKSHGVHSQHATTVIHERRTVTKGK